VLGADGETSSIPVTMLLMRMSAANLYRLMMPAFGQVRRQEGDLDYRRDDFPFPVPLDHNKTG
jgi:hypothetical protein